LKVLKLIIAAILIGNSIAAVAQENTVSEIYKNELGIDVANILTFLSKKNESYLVNYKRRLTEKHTLRSGLNLDWSTATDGHKSVGIKGGYERGCPIVSDHWKLHFGVDASLLYRTNNFQSNKAIRCGLSPVIGFSYFPVKRFSIATEASLNFFYTDYHNPKSFDPDDSKNVFDINIGSIGMLVVSYHF
jgi:hypothetical protein